MGKKVNIEFRHFIEKKTRADVKMCWMCSSCDIECPMNIATNRLRPQKIVRLASLGLFDELIGMPEIWYCLTCRRCNHVCPNCVKPADIVSFARKEALRFGVVSHSHVQNYYALFARFQRVRWRAVEQCLNGKLDGIPDVQWDTWFETPVRYFADTIQNSNLFQSNGLFYDLILNAKGSSCFTCGECSSACPISGSRNVFDPRFIFRMANLGMLYEILRSPTIWLCLDCRRCTEACSQLVDGYQIIQNLQMLAVQSGIVDTGIVPRIREANIAIYPRFLEKVDLEFGIKN